MTGRRLVVLDPGHGGSAVTGGSSPNRGAGAGLLEKDLALDLAQRTRSALATDHTVVLTRETDVNLTLAARAGVARGLGADAFVSLHLSGADDAALDRTDVVVGLAGNPGRLALAEAIRRELAGVTGAGGEVLQADLGLLAADRHDPRTAACLAEVACLTNPAQAARLADPGYREALAGALAAGIRQAGLAPAGTLAQVFPDYTSAHSFADAVMMYVDWLARGLRFTVGVGDTRFFPHSAICRIDILDASGGDLGSGTGFYVGSNKVVTAGHVVNGAAGFEIRPGLNGTTQPFGGGSTSTSVRHPSLDIGVITGAPSAPNGAYFAMEELVMSPETGVIVCGYAGDEQDPTRQHLDVDTIRLVQNGSFTYGLQTRHGTSGAPVFYAPDQQTVRVVGVHSGGYDAQTNLGQRLTNDVIAWINSL